MTTSDSPEETSPLPLAINLPISSAPGDLEVRLFDRQKTTPESTLAEVRKDDVDYFNFKMDAMRGMFASGNLTFKRMLSLFDQLDKCVIQRRHILGLPYGSPEAKASAQRPVLPISSRSSS